MRVRVDVEADVPSLHWKDVHGPARGVLYSVLRTADAELAGKLHDAGWAGHRVKPVGLTSPQFRGAPKKAGVYTTSRDGSVWFGSPVPEIASALVTGLATRKELAWGPAKLRIRGFTLDIDAPPAGDEVELSTATPVILKHDSRYLLPGDEHYVERLRHNLWHKADVLSLPAPGALRVLEAGPQRRFMVRGSPRIGAQVRVALSADPRLVDALRSWGLGLDTLQGFGWVR
ncbi:CRISPR-associated endoribonuclease Cas6 [Streptomyces sp. WMMB 322]|uniref:CRISPR-associated endoribonuclease Cas6 n=1 Tax=Streptomyces sp. WMMB 322 TaxID=1286821 RepID=UPI000823F7F4|nr:CRISPR-associated endoribonuclease Cas6 [Streptomyces sp. WMMB 322]SCK12588.1 CRISPR-associated protein, Cas6 family [Streptomyces sp. WMMB 322]